MHRRAVLTELGPDGDALRREDRTGILFDLGLGSGDDTVRIAQEKGAKVVHQDWLGFGPQKNFALTLTSGDWILWLDSDEAVSPELAASIKDVIQRADADGYEMSRLSSFCGRPLA